MGKRIGFVGIVLEDLQRSAQVNAIVAQYSHLVTGRIGVPDHGRGIAVIGLLVEGDNESLGGFTGRLGNVPGVSVRSAMTAKEWDDEGENDV